tara:strand:- start:1599 stop:2603 length:1005 start_codon:yes stop_codon:yes gene_type:complete
MINFALIGAGRIGKVHAKNILENNECNLLTVYDIDRKNSEFISKLNNSKIAESPEVAINNKEVDAVLIASATDTHIEFILKSVKANKSIFCEKPIDLDIYKVNKCYDIVKNFSYPIQIGFNRRFDSNNIKLKKAKENGDIGNLEMIIITSRDPSPSTLEYHKSSGGLFKDCTIHDFDLSRFLLGDDPIEEINAFGSQLFSEQIKSINDHDTAMIQMKSKKGVLVHINNSRRAVYGYDQRVEIFGSKGMLISNNYTQTNVEKFLKNATSIKDPILDFFIERYDKAYKSQLNHFVNSIINKQMPLVNFDDGRKALILADHAYKSLKESKNIIVNYE